MYHIYNLKSKRMMFDKNQVEKNLKIFQDKLKETVEKI